MRKRQLSQQFIDDLLTGVLNPLLKEVQEDDTLCMELRGNRIDLVKGDRKIISYDNEAINIYYRGGSLFKITRVNRVDKEYDIFFDVGYCKGQANTSVCKTDPDVDYAVENIAIYKHTMDKWFSKNLKMERELQQFIVRENNNTTISNSTDYFIIDIEYATSESNDAIEEYNKVNGRFDMVAFKWPSLKRTGKKNKSLALIELKYGDNSYNGSSGVRKHLDDFNDFLNDKKRLAEFCDDMAMVFQQKCKLGLIRGFDDKKGAIKIDNDNTEAIFIFANHNPKSDILKGVLAPISQANYNFPIKVAHASTMGTCLHEKKMMDIDDFKMKIAIEDGKK